MLDHTTFQLRFYDHLTTTGSRQSARAVIPNIIVQLLNNKKTINLGSVKPVRDFMFIEDTVKAFNNVILKKSLFWSNSILEVILKYLSRDDIKNVKK